MPSGAERTDQKVAIVTGAASGIGAATVRRLAANGYAVVAADLSPSVQELATDDGRISVVVGDLTEVSANEHLVAEANARHGRIDALVLNAGLTTHGGIGAAPIAEFDRVMAVNVRATVAGLQAALPSLRRSRGVVSVTCSIQGLHGDPTLWIYSASKGAVVNLVRSVALDLAKDGIRVNGVCPGPIEDTGMTRDAKRLPEVYARVAGRIPLLRWGRADEVANAHLFLLSSDSSFMTGAMLTLDGGLTAGTGVYSPSDVMNFNMLGDAKLVVDSKHSILMVMDFQPMVLDALSNGGELVGNVADAVRAAKKAGIRVGYVRVGFDDADYAAISERNKTFGPLADHVGFMHANLPDTALHSELAPEEGDVVVRKTRFGAFSTTDLAQQLHDAQIDTVILAGVSTSGVVLSTVRDAADRDLRIFVLSDGCGDPDDEVHELLMSKVFPAQADVITVAELKDAIG